jgi:predicted DCC family thiol-disulfide oxidoreductase YuxK
MPSPSPQPIVLFDGVCNLCNAAVQWIIARDPKAIHRFASLQSIAGQQALRDASAPAELPDSIVLIDSAGVHTRSTAALRIARQLAFPWPLAAAGLALPRALRDPVYDFIARRRYAWFGRQPTCTLPTPALRARFLDEAELIAPTDGPRRTNESPLSH